MTNRATQKLCARWIPTLAMVLTVATALLVLGCQRGLLDKEESGPMPKNSLEAAYRWPGDKTVASDGEGNQLLKLRHRRTGVVVYDKESVPIGRITTEKERIEIRPRDGEEKPLLIVPIDDPRAFLPNAEVGPVDGRLQGWALYRARYKPGSSDQEDADRDELVTTGTALTRVLASRGETEQWVFVNASGETIAELTKRGDDSWIWDARKDDREVSLERSDKSARELIATSDNDVLLTARAPRGTSPAVLGPLLMTDPSPLARAALSQIVAASGQAE